MKRFTAARARQQFASLLDAVERGEPVVVERRGVQFSVTTVPRPGRRKRRKPVFRILDSAVRDGQWTWDIDDSGGFAFRPRAPRP